MWCMWLSDSGSGFGKIVKRQTDLQKKCQKGLHNDIKIAGSLINRGFPFFMLAKYLQFFKNITLAISYSISYF